MKKKILLITFILSCFAGGIYAEQYLLSCGKIVTGVGIDSFRDKDGNVNTEEYKGYLADLESLCTKEDQPSNVQMP